MEGVVMGKDDGVVVLMDRVDKCENNNLVLRAGNNKTNSGSSSSGGLSNNSIVEDSCSLGLVKMSGYLEKRSKVLGWKRFWFVLDGRLLTYYKSKSEYESLSACLGSVNLGIATNVSPIRASKGYPLQIVTRTQVYYLRANDKPQLDRWLIAIQEAATVPPSISLPYWTDPGVQFYRYSFTALSQWSLETSTEDVSSSTRRNLPQNFYRPTSILKKCHSFAALNFNLSSNKASALHKSSHHILDSDDYFSQSYNTYHSTLGYKSTRHKSPEKSRNNNRIKTNLSKMRHTSSMLVLESSPQASQLRRELARKLSIPSTLSHNNNNNVNMNSQGQGGSSSGGSPSSQASSNASRHPHPPPAAAHPFGNIYTNFQTTPDPHHDYDEILDLNNGIYEPCGVPASQTLSSSPPSEGIYENVETHQPRLDPSKPLEDPWEVLSPALSSSPNKNPLGNPAGASESTQTSRTPTTRRSFQNRDSSGRNSLVSISEVPEKESHHVSGTKKFGSQYTPHHYSGDVSERNSDLWERSSDKDSDSTSNHSESKGKRKSSRGSKRTSLSGFFQKIFTKGDKKKNKEADAREMVITGPVDLRKIAEEARSKQLSRSNSKDEGALTTTAPSQTNKLHLHGLKPAIGSSFNSSENLIQELNKKIGERKISQQQQQPLPDLTSSARSRYPSKTFSQSSLIEEEEKTEGTRRRAPAPPSRNRNSGPLIPDECGPLSRPRVDSNQESAEYLKKLARFNRLSASLNPSFIAALTQQTGHGVGPNATAKVGRSQSCRIRPFDEPPLLPPKGKQLPRFPEYDVPQNNSPVQTMEKSTKAPCKDPVIPSPPRSISALRELTKKHSAPEISFSSSGSPSLSVCEDSSLLLKCMESSSTEVFEIPPEQELAQVSTPLPMSNSSSESPQSIINPTPPVPAPPPRPPKSDKPSNYGNLLIIQQCYEPEESPALVVPEPRHLKGYVNLKAKQRMASPDRGAMSLPAILPDVQQLPESTSVTEPEAQQNKNTVPDPILNTEAVLSETLDRSINSVVEVPTLLETELQEDPACNSVDDKQSYLEDLDGVHGEAEGKTITSKEALSPARCEELPTSQDSATSAESVLKLESADQEQEVSDPAPVASAVTASELPKLPTLRSSLHAQVLDIPEMLTIIENEEPDSPTSSDNKSLDIDSLEVLSDICSEASPAPTPPPVQLLPEAEAESEKPVNREPGLVLGHEIANLLHPCHEIQFPSNEYASHVVPTSCELSICTPSESPKQPPESASQSQQTLTLPELALPQEAGEEEENDSHFYDDVPFESGPTLKINYAAFGSVPWETVEETEEEIYEMYDEFPADNYTCSPSSAVTTTSDYCHAETKSLETAHVVSPVCHSAIEELQDFLAQEPTSSISDVIKPKSGGLGSVNRLGHSSAIEQLKKLTATEEVI